MAYVTLLYLAYSIVGTTTILAFNPTLPIRKNSWSHIKSCRNKDEYIMKITRLYAVPKRIARRNLKKRPNRRMRKGKSRTLIDEDNEIWKNSEKRPLVRSLSIEAGEDYWIDEGELRKSMEREQAIKNRKVNGNIYITCLSSLSKCWICLCFRCFS